MWFDAGLEPSYPSPGEGFGRWPSDRGKTVSMTEPKHSTINARRARFHTGPPPDLGKVIHGKEIPSDVALATPLIIRVTEFLQAGNLLAADFKNKFQMCLEEALRNAIIH